MKEKKILIISASFYPQNSPRSFRTTELAKELIKQGHKVDVLTHYNKLHEGYISSSNFRFLYYNDLTWKPVSIRGGRIEKLMRRGLKRASSLFLQYPNIELLFKIVAALKKVDAHYDAIISIAVPHTIHWAVARNNKRDITDVWIADCGDPFMGQENDSFQYPFYFKYVEKWWCKLADFITVPTEGAIKAYYPEFRKKIRVIPQGFNFNAISLPEYVRNKQPTFAYAGALIPGVRDPKPLVEYLEKFNIDYSFLIFTRSTNLVKGLERQTNGRVKVIEPIPRNELMPILAKMDFLINFENKGSRQTPSKLIDYSITKRPILSLPPLSVDEKLIREFINYDFSNRFVVKNLDNYRIENVAKQFLDLM